MARLRAICRSSTFMFWSAGLLAIPGIILSKSSIGPMFCTWSNWSMKSLKSKVFSRIFSAISRAFCSSYSWEAFSIKVSMSPMPRIRLDIRSGWKVSMSVIFSPVPVNLIGFPVMWRTDRATPPRVSPSILVRITPVTSNWALNSRATLAASWPIMASITSNISFGWASALTSRSSFMRSSSICKRPAVSIKT